MPFPPKPDPVKFCQTCGERMYRKRFNGRLEDRTRFLSRKNCSQTCGNSRNVIQADSHRQRARRIKPRTSCEECAAKQKLHVHHRDRDVTNNDSSNLVVLCASCHLRLHWREDRDERMASISASTRRPCSDGKRYLDGKLPPQLSPQGRAAGTD